uniref:Uncharacterized protein n=1 Tax=Sphaerodactylus townsendi TaxID=933632 RepID=A0ACB8EDV0_9SAUR
MRPRLSGYVTTATVIYNLERSVLLGSTQAKINSRRIKIPLSLCQQLVWVLFFVSLLFQEKSLLQRLGIYWNRFLRSQQDRNCLQMKRSHSRKIVMAEPDAFPWQLVTEMGKFAKSIILFFKEQSRHIYIYELTLFTCELDFSFLSIIK